MGRVFCIFLAEPLSEYSFSEEFGVAGFVCRFFGIFSGSGSDSFLQFGAVISDLLSILIELESSVSNV